MQKNARGPLPGLWEGRYFSFRDDCLHRYGEKLYKIPLDIGCTCPNRDGTAGTGGCTFCGSAGAGEFAGDRTCSVTAQLEEGKAIARRIRPGIRHYIAYFQAFSNTYAPLQHLREAYEAAAADEDVRVLSIATRPDCFSEEIYDLLAEINRLKPVWVELGLQTVHDGTAEAFHRGYPYAVFEETLTRLHGLGLPVTVHLIAGLPGETKEDFCESVRRISRLPVSGVKFHLLYLIRGTALAGTMDPSQLLSEEEYLDWLSDGIALLRPDISIQRLTGDPPKDLVIGPSWCLRKGMVLNHIGRALKEKDIVQGCRYLPA